MRMRLSILTTVLAVLWFALQGQAHEITGRNHHRRQFSGIGNNTAAESSSQLGKRFSNTRFTLYDAGLSACGGTFSNSDFIVALNAAQYAGGALCFKTITITVNGKSTPAKIVDMCPGCPFGALDLSRGLFDFFAPESVGVLYGSWTLGDGQPASSPSTSVAPTPSPTHTHTTTTSSTWSTSSSTWSTSSSTSSKTSSTTSSSSTSSTSSSAVSTTSTSSAALPTDTATASDGTPSGLIEELNVVFVQVGRMMLL